MNNTDFIEEIVEDWSDRGFAEKINDTTLGSLNDDTVIEFEPIVEKEENVGLKIFVDGDETFSGNYDDPDFSEKLFETLRNNLNI